MRRLANLYSLLLVAFLVFSSGESIADETPATNHAQQILASSGISGGFVVHLGCGDGELTTALRANDAFTVHGLEPDANLVGKARSFIQSRGVYGPVSVEQFSGERLPYTDNLINLVVVSNRGGVPSREINRVLAPGGVVCTLQGETWATDQKPWPDSIDQWGHFLYDATNNAVANDTEVGPPRNLQWIVPPLWLRSHETPSGIQSPVSADGRLIYFFDEGLIGITDERLPDRWSLVCRDAFNGKLLWKRPLSEWGWRAWSRDKYEGMDWTKLRAGRTDVPLDNQRLIVADGNRLYTSLTYRGPLSILDAATGETETTVAETNGASEILVSEGIAVVYTQQTPSEDARRRGQEEKTDAAFVAIQGETGKVLWSQPTEPIKPLGYAIDDGVMVCLTAKQLRAVNLRDGKELWNVQPSQTNVRALLISDKTIVMQGGSFAAAFDLATGDALWNKKVSSIGGGEGDDLFVVDGLVWRGMMSVDDAGKPVRKSENALVIGWDLRTGHEEKEILVNNLRSPEHHHRCYRNKATSRFMISSFEGAEFLNFDGDDHGQNNFVRGACKFGMTPCNGMLYVPPDQCFCQPGAKLLGYAALKAPLASSPPPVADAQRLVKGPAFGQATGAAASADDWPTLRHDPARSGSTKTAVSPDVAFAWTSKLEGPLSAPVAADGRVFVAQKDAHVVCALDAETGETLWRYTANGRIDSPPTIYRGTVLFGSSDGCVYCLRASDGELAWRFLAAPCDTRIGYFDQIESSWPVHGSILIHENVAYCTAGRSTYLDGGIRAYGLEPASGQILYQGLLEGPHRSVDTDRDLAFFIEGANSDVLVSEGGYLYMRQKKMTPELEEIDVDILSTKGAQDVGLHVFSTSGLLDGSGYNRAFWMYSKRWPGFQLANQAPKAGQLLVVDDETTFAVRTFYRRNVHSPMFFPETEGYLLFADLNTNEPQILGEPGSVEPLRWLPQSDYSRGRGDEMRALDSEAFGLDKMIGYTRAQPPLWTTWLPVRMQAMVKTANTIFVAGAPDVLDPSDPFAAFEDRKGGKLVAISAADGEALSEIPLAHEPVFDGLIAANGHLFASLRDGSLVCFKGQP